MSYSLLDKFKIKVNIKKNYGIATLGLDTGRLLATFLYTSCISKREYTVFIGEVYKKPRNGYHLQPFMIHGNSGQIRPKRSNCDKMVKFGQNCQILSRTLIIHSVLP